MYRVDRLQDSLLARSLVIGSSVCSICISVRQVQHVHVVAYLQNESLLYTHRLWWLGEESIEVKVLA